MQKKYLGIALLIIINSGTIILFSYFCLLGFFINVKDLYLAHELAFATRISIEFLVILALLIIPIWLINFTIYRYVLDSKFKYKWGTITSAASITLMATSILFAKNAFIKVRHSELNSTTHPNRIETISNPANKLDGNTQTLVLEYIVWGCACAPWITSENYKKYQDSGLASHCIYIEAANDSLDVPKSFDPFKQKIRVTGQFYVLPDLPKGTTPSEEPMKKAKVFCFNKIMISDK